MARLVEEARRTPRPDVRLGTLERLKTACDDILSGEAAKLAKRLDPSRAVQFGGRPLRLHPALIEAYVRLRNRETPEPKRWTGPTAAFIRQDEDLRSYVSARFAEELAFREPQRPRSRKASFERSLESLSFENQMAIRERIEEGLEAKRKLNLLRASLRTMPAIDVDALVDGVGRAGAAPAPRSVLGPTDRVCLRQLIARLRDPLEMREFGLVYASQRLMMADPPETELIRKREFELLLALAEDDGRDG
ncbi:hypothetical protein [Jiella sonneratiae]|uniref:Uncharacterized protein n=1 Tax=Jiella sonneratiae TaxID=2816856 RepID=A0ABS3IZ60_9HYPH|nr:hypothetical protein [Jiella sonneratiae]MBO0902702.1 hypothetical protein [Jiella sonneratiae]